tara:strand:- start:12780 stop:13070 length:291 start_codon:yes stop_codon:yes gene_type:complete
MAEKNITRADIANVLSKDIGISRSESSYFVDTIITEITSSLISNKSLKISSFGTFKVRYKNKRIGRNPKTGVEHTISARNTISFIASKILKNKLNK